MSLADSSGGHYRAQTPWYLDGGHSEAGVAGVPVPELGGVRAAVARLGQDDEPVAPVLPRETHGYGKAEDGAREHGKSPGVSIEHAQRPVGSRAGRTRKSRITGTVAWQLHGQQPPVVAEDPGELARSRDGHALPG